MHRLIGIIILGCFSFTSCCTLTRDSYQTLAISSSPPHAMIFVDGCPVGDTPRSFELDTKRDHDILVTKEGYFPWSYTIQSKTSAGKLGSNAVFPLAGGAIGALAGLAIGQGTGPYALAFIPLGALLGLAAGTAMGITGAGVDVYSKKARKLSTSRIHADLTTLPPPYLSCCK